MSQAVGKPVRLQFMRWDEHGWDNYGPPSSIDVRAGIDANGKIVAFDFTALVASGWTSTETTQELSAPRSRRPASAAPTRRTRGAQYAIPNRRVDRQVAADGYEQGFLKTASLRAPGAPQALFGSEQMIDELAYAAKMDPLEFRLQNSTTTHGVERWIGVLDAAAKAASWQPRVAALEAGRRATSCTGRGVAIGGFASTLAGDRRRHRGQQEDRQDHGRRTSTRAQDAGLAVNPASVENQIDRRLDPGHEPCAPRGGRASRRRASRASTGSTYPILRFKDARR